jgi:hypothetical protein
MMGLEVNALNGTVTFAPHVPAGWSDFAIKNVKVGSAQLDLVYHVVGDDITLEVTRRGGKIELDFSPAVSLRARVLAADVDGRKITPKIAANDSDQHATIAVPITADKTTIHLRVAGNFAIGYTYSAPADGAASTALKVVSEHWNASNDELVVQVAGVNGKTYELPVFNVPSGIGVTGAEFTKPPSGLALEIAFPPGDSGVYTTRTVTLKFPAH